MNGSNNDIYAYLLDFAISNRNADFAILLNGKWGSGKTHFVKKLREEINKAKGDKYCLYASLNGINNIKDIDSQFFQQLHPFWSNKNVKTMTALGRGLLKASIKFDLDENFSFEVNPAISKVNKPDETEKLLNGQVLIFDDLERCSLPISEVLGYINSLTEHEKFRVIIVADEEKIGCFDNELGKNYKGLYDEFKEKVIGQTVSIENDVNSIIESIIDKVKNEKLKRFLFKYKEEIVQIFNSSKTNNFRALNHVIYSFERLSAKFNKDVWKRDDILLSEMRIFFSLSILSKNNTFSFGEIPKFYSQRLANLLAVNKDTPIVLKLKSYNEMFPGIEPKSSKVKLDDLDNYIFKGTSIDAVAQGINNSINPTKVPLLVRLWRYYDLEDDEFTELYKEFKYEWEHLNFKTDGEILHAIGIQIKLNELTDEFPSIADLESHCKQYIDNISSAQRLMPMFGGEYLPDIEGGSSGGLGYLSGDRPEFSNVKKYLVEKRKKLGKELIPEKLIELLSKMENDAIEFLRDICWTEYRESPFSKVPVFESCDAKEFFEKFISLKNKEKEVVISALKLRYTKELLKNELKVEIPFLKQFNYNLINTQECLEPVSKYRRRWHIDALEGILKGV